MAEHAAAQAMRRGQYLQSGPSVVRAGDQPARDARAAVAVDLVDHRFACGLERAVVLLDLPVAGSSSCATGELSSMGFEKSSYTEMLETKT